MVEIVKVYNEEKFDYDITGITMEGEEA